MPDRPLIAAIGCGGTISSLGRDSTDVLDYPDFGTKLPIEEVLGRYPEISELADVLPVPFRSVGSTAIGPLEWLELSAVIHGLAAERPELAGFVIPHGTATLEETAYFLHLALKTDKTVVVVGAQRPASALGSDAGMNLFGAVRVALAPAARGLGVLVSLNDEIHSAREASKTSTYRLRRFARPISGCSVISTATACRFIDGLGAATRQTQTSTFPGSRACHASILRIPTAVPTARSWTHWWPRAPVASFPRDWRRAFHLRSSGLHWSGRATQESSSCNQVALAAAVLRCAVISTRLAWWPPIILIRRKHAFC
jgi:Asparaginase, N-terminal